MCLHFDKIRTLHPADVWNSLSSACTAIRWNLWKLFHPVKQWLKSLLRDHWPLTTIFRADNFSTFFKSEAFTFSSASSIKFIQVWPETLQHIEVFAPFLFISFARKWFLSFGFLESSDPFSYIFCSDSHSCVVVFLIKQLFFSGLLDIKSALRASLIISHFISIVPL